MYAAVNSLKTETHPKPSPQSMDRRGQATWTQASKDGAMVASFEGVISESSIVVTHLPWAARCRCRVSKIAGLPCPTEQYTTHEGQFLVREQRHIWECETEAKDGRISISMIEFHMGPDLAPDLSPTLLFHRSEGNSDFQTINQASWNS